MWVISAPFDAETPKAGEAAKPESRKTKLLKPNSSYILGRKEKALVISNQKISKDHCQFVVGDHTIDDASNPSSRPSLELVIIKAKKLTVEREGKDIKIDPSQKLELQHDDVITLVLGIEAKVEWRPIYVYSPIIRGKGSISIDACAALGIKLLYTQNAKATHHLISHYVANLSTAASLLSVAHFVKPEWLQEVIRLGNKDEDVTSLEENFVLPLESRYKPAFSPSLLQSQKTFSIWETDETRVDLFSSCRFVCLREKVRELDSELQDVIQRGKGTWEAFDIHSGMTKFHRTLTRCHAKEGKKVVIIADADLMQAAVGSESWREYVAEAMSFKLEIHSPSQLIQAVLETKVEGLFPSVSADTDSNAGPSRNFSPLPDVVPNSISDEPSITLEASGSQAPRRLVRRVTRSVTREPSQAPTLEPEKADEPAPSGPRKLVRRVVTAVPIITGLNDPSSVIDAVPDLPPRDATPLRDVYDFTAPTPARSTRLKRRVGVAVPDNQPSSMLSEIAETMEEEPPLKKFKALFDASAPDEAGHGSLYQPNASQTQSDILSQTLQQMAVSSPAALREEEEEATQSGMPIEESQRGHKRRLESMVEDAEMGDGDELSLAATAALPSKRRAIEDVNSVERDEAAAPRPPTSKPPSTVASTAKNHGAAAGKPDTDAAFLKAIASTKRGKKTEDVFDREFNQLRISKPEIETRRDPEEEWGVLAEFGDDTGLRGNFMTIVEMDVYRKDLQQKPPPNRSLDGKPNFKKFKQKIAGVMRAKVEVFLREENDYGMGSAYWKGGKSQAPDQAQNSIFGSQSQSHPYVDMESQDDFSTQPRSRPAFDNDEADSQPAPRKSRKPASRGEFAAPERAAATRSKAVTKPASALFLDSDDDIPLVKEKDQEDRLRSDMEQNESSTLRSSTGEQAPSPKRPTRSSKPATKAKTKKPAIIDDDDSGDGIVFKGFKGRKGKH